MRLDPPSAVAASICWLARWRSGTDRRTPGSQLAGIAATAVGLRHPSECGWCAYPSETLIDWIEEFNEADLVRTPGGLAVDAAGQPIHRIAGRFHAMPRLEQRRLVDAAMYPEAVR